MWLINCLEMLSVFQAGVTIIIIFYLFCPLADAFIQSDLQMRTLLKQSKLTKEQKHASAIRSPG